jgi:hypothetical protein
MVIESFHLNFIGPEGPDYNEFQAQKCHFHLQKKKKIKLSRIWARPEHLHYKNQSPILIPCKQDPRLKSCRWGTREKVTNNQTKYSKRPECIYVVLVAQCWPEKWLNTLS